MTSATTARAGTTDRHFGALFGARGPIPWPEGRRHTASDDKGVIIKRAQLGVVARRCCNGHTRGYEPPPASSRSGSSHRLPRPTKALQGPTIKRVALLRRVGRGASSACPCLPIRSPPRARPSRSSPRTHRLLLRRQAVPIAGFSPPVPPESEIGTRGPRPAGERRSRKRRGRYPRAPEPDAYPRCAARSSCAS